MTRSAPAEAAGTLLGSTGAKAPIIQVVIRLMVEVRAFTGAGSSGLTIEPLGKRNATGRKHPPLVGMRGSVSARTAKHAAASEPEGTQLSGPRTCALVPSKSKVIVPSL